MSRKTHRGFSLVEMMVAMTIGLILIGGALSVLYSSKVMYNENERVARLQESGRAAMELMLRDMRAGGFKGCNQNTVFTNALGSTALRWNFAAPAQGFESTGAGTWSPAVDTSVVITPRNFSDILAVRTSRIDAPTFTTNASMASPTADFTVDRTGTDTMPNGSSVMISDCSAATVFWATSFSASGSTATITHAGSDLGIAYPVGARVVPVDTVIYYIRDSNTVRNGVRNPSLWSIIGSGGPEELIEGIESMQLLYGVDTDGDRLVNSYVKASAVGAANWNRVISVSIALLLRSIEPNSITPDKRSYFLLDTTLGPYNDRYQRVMYTTTVTLRNNTQ